MSSGRIHEVVSVAALVTIIALLQFYKVSIELVPFVAAWLFGTFYLSPDLDATYSRPKNRVKGFKYLFIFTHHRGIMHNPYLWCLIFFFCGIAGYPFIGLGLMGSAIIHIMVDKY